MEWIDLKEKKPKHQQKVLVKGHFPFEVDCTYIQLENGYDFERKLKKSIIHFSGITHWKPIEK